MVTLREEALTPHTGKLAPVTDDEFNRLRLDVPMWEVVHEGGTRRLRRTFDFDRYTNALRLVNNVGYQADADDHHPEITLRYGSVTVEWYTHTIGDLHRNDFIMAAKTDAAYLQCLDDIRKTSTVGEASRESFPASDPPGWIGKTAEDEENPPG